MAQQELWYGSQGPLLYDDTSTYPDLVPREASRAPQHYVEDAPTEPYHVVTKGYLDTVGVQSAVYWRISSGVNVVVPDYGLYMIYRRLEVVGSLTLSAGAELVIIP
jgi:hypothetical protein